MWEYLAFSHLGNGGNQYCNCETCNVYTVKDWFTACRSQPTVTP